MEIIAYYFYLISSPCATGLDKGIPTTGNENARGNVDALVHKFTATALGKGRVASPTLGRLYPGKISGTHLTEG